MRKEIEVRMVEIIIINNINIINNISKELRRVQRTRENYNEYSLVFVFPQTGSSVEQVTLVFGGEL